MMDSNHIRQSARYLTANRSRLQFRSELAVLSKLRTVKNLSMMLDANARSHRNISMMITIEKIRINS